MDKKQKGQCRDLGQEADLIILAQHACEYSGPWIVAFHSPFSFFSIRCAWQPSSGRPLSNARKEVTANSTEAEHHPHPLSQNPSWEWPGSRMRKGEAGVHSWPGWKCRSLLTLYFALQRVVLSWDGCQSHKIKRGKCEIKGSHFRVAGCFLGGKKKKKVMQSSGSFLLSKYPKLSSFSLFYRWISSELLQILPGTILLAKQQRNTQHALVRITWNKAETQIKHVWRTEGTLQGVVCL